MIFFGAVAALLYVFFLGLAWPHRSALPLGTAIWGYFAKSLFLAWFVFLLSFNTNFDSGARVATLLILAGAFVSMRDSKLILEIGDSDPWPRFRMRTILAVGIATFLAWPAITSFGTIFTEWDAVVSLHRWAAELSTNTYFPMTTAYPILWSSVWSLIYEAQGTNEIWYVAKATAGAPVLFFAIYAAGRILSKQPASALMLCVLTWLVFLRQSKWVVSGYIDIPVAIMSLMTLMLMVDGIDADDADRREEIYLLAVISGAVAIVTKQTGLMAAGLVGLFLMYETFRRRIDFPKLVNFGIITLLPAATFLMIYLERRPGLFGNFGHLRSDTLHWSGEAGAFARALELISATYPIPAFVLLAIGAILNILFVKSRRGALGVACLALAFAGLSAFSYCCSYDVRNSFVPFSLLIVSAFVGYSSFEAWVRARLLPRFSEGSSSGLVIRRSEYVAAFGSMALVLAVLSTEYPEEKLVAKSELDKTYKLGFPPTNLFLLQNRGAIDDASRIVSMYQLLHYFPLTRGKYSWCMRPDETCLSTVMEEAGVDSIALLTFDWNQTSESAAFLENLSATGVAELIAEDAANATKLFRITKERWLAR